jgi:hypothetical protein
VDFTLAQIEGNVVERLQAGVRLADRRRLQKKFRFAHLRRAFIRAFNGQ